MWAKFAAWSFPPESRRGRLIFPATPFQMSPLSAATAALTRSATIIVTPHTPRPLEPTVIEIFDSDDEIPETSSEGESPQTCPSGSTDPASNEACSKDPVTVCIPDVTSGCQRSPLRGPVTSLKNISRSPRRRSSPRPETRIQQRERRAKSSAKGRRERDALAERSCGRAVAEEKCTRALSDAMIVTREKKGDERQSDPQGFGVIALEDLDKVPDQYPFLCCFL